MLITAAKASEAAEVLAVTLDGLTAKAVSDAYRTKAKSCHPDKHGNSQLALWAKVSWAKEVLERWVVTAPTEQPGLSAEGDCRCCGGSGRVAVRSSGFGRPMTMLCVMCNGSGEMRKEPPDEMESR